jgi:hypothetical protein
MNPSKSSVLILSVLGTVICSACSADAQSLLSRKEKQEAVRTIAEAYERHYVFPDMGKKMADLVRGKMEAGQYDAFKDGRELGQQITRDFQALCQDRHVVVAYTPERILKRKKKDPRVLADEELESSRRENFGFRELRIMNGNVGYLKISSFEGSPEALAVAAAAMRFLSNCDAIILDLRFNPGGDSAMVQFLASYFLGEEPVLLDEFHYRREGKITQLWSLPYVPGKKPVQADLYILTDSFTFSAAEGLAYDLQALKKTVIAGTPSAGGAHVTEIHTVLDRFTLYIPVAFSKNPVTGTNFQGKGVQPDIKVSGETAVQQIQLHALEKRIEKSSDPERKAELERICREIRNSLAAANHS